MATDTSAGGKKKAGKKAKTGEGEKALRRVDESFVEYRYEPAAGGGAYAGAVVMSLGGIALGMGAYAMIALQGRPLYEWGRWLLALGAGLVVVYLLIGGKKVGALRVGYLGVGFEEDGKTARTPWYEITRVKLGDRALRLETGKRTVVVPLDAHGNGAARIVSEAQSRIPKRVALEDDDIAGLGSSAGGARVPAEPPQVTQAHCRATDEPLTFEKDVRMCGRCGALYHRSGVPRRCLECSRKLKSAAA